MELIIKNVALYLRKSRDESDGLEDVLSKHESLLLSISSQRGYNILHVYKEIGSSQSIDVRDEMLQMLDDVKLGRYDAVMVVDLDRLSRGNWLEFGRIQVAFAESKTLVITPNRIYDFNDDFQELLTSVEHLIGRQEYKQAVKRMQRGKIGGVQQGKWTNGKPPYPYRYDRNTKTIIVEDDNRVVYNRMLSWFLEDEMPCYKIAWELNKLGIPSATGSQWSENGIYRILTSEVHCGYVIYGKTSGSGHIKKKALTGGVTLKDPSQWMKVQGIHEVLKTEQQHALLMAKLERKRVVPREARKQKKRPLSGILFCSKCGYSLQFTEKSKGRLMVKTCQHANPVGVRCGNRGIYADHIYFFLNQELDRYEQELLSQTPKQDQADTSTLKIALKNKRQEIAELRQALERAEDRLMRGKIDEDRYERFEQQFTKEIDQAIQDVNSIESSIRVLQTSKNDTDRLSSLNTFKLAWNGGEASAEDLNTLAKALFDRVEYSREGSDIDIKVKFL